MEREAGLVGGTGLRKATLNFTQLPALGPDFPYFCRPSLWEGGLEERRRESSEEEGRKAEEEEASAEREKTKLSAW